MSTTAVITSFELEFDTTVAFRETDVTLEDQRATVQEWMRTPPEAAAPWEQVNSATGTLTMFDRSRVVSVIVYLEGVRRSGSFS